MALRNRIASPPTARRPPTEPVVPLNTTCRRFRVVGAWLLFGLVMFPGASASDPRPGPAPIALTASVSDTPDGVRLRIQASGEVNLDVTKNRPAAPVVDGPDACPGPEREGTACQDGTSLHVHHLRRDRLRPGYLVELWVAQAGVAADGATPVGRHRDLDLIICFESTVFLSMTRAYV